MMRRSTRRLTASSTASINLLRNPNLTSRSALRKPAGKTTSRRLVASSDDASESSSASDFAQESESEELSDYEDDYEDDLPPAKRQKRVVTSKTTLQPTQQAGDDLYAPLNGQACATASLPPSRPHTVKYHRSLFLDETKGRTSRDALLTWFDGVSSARSMPWRKPWLDPSDLPDASAMREALERRAYEVWISEIMLQQTRVAVVIGYWNAWMARWPTIHDLARAEPDEVLSAWRGLGYYSRATRIHEAAKLVVQDPKMKGLLPASATELEAKVPGVGRYTGGAISSIVFGLPAPMVDGNVLRVLSRQLGIFGDVKGDKKVIDALWRAAEALANAVARDCDSEEEPPKPSDRPGRWGQALMELGSTICSPRPNCAACPVTSTCRAYAEGRALATSAGHGNPKDIVDAIGDIEDVCALCEPWQESDEEQRSMNAPGNGKKPKAQRTKISAFFSAKNNTSRTSADALEIVTAHASKFPLKKAKKKVREEHTLVCAIRRWDGHYLIHRRPSKGLLAGLWELPSQEISLADQSKPKLRKSAASSYAKSLFDGAQPVTSEVLRHQAEIGCIPWQFSHIKLTMHVHLFQLDGGEDTAGADSSNSSSEQAKWISGEQLDHESMGTGMRKCWALAKEMDTD